MVRDSSIPPPPKRQRVTEKITKITDWWYNERTKVWVEENRFFYGTKEMEEHPDPMTEARVKEMIDLRSEISIDFDELIRAVSFMRCMLRGIGVDLGDDCTRCLRSMSNHNNDTCHESNQEDHCTFSKRQVARLQQGIFALEEDRRRRAETVTI